MLSFLSDPEFATWPLLGSPWPISILLVSYLLFVWKLGKKFMEHRQPYDLKKVMVVYNTGQIIYNGVLFSLASKSLQFIPCNRMQCIYRSTVTVYIILILGMYDLRCLEKLPLDSPMKNLERVVSYAYFINKIIDLLDTVFFILRKNYKQITFLHVYHHAVMIFCFYWITRFYGAGGQLMSMGFLNTFVHTVMYYYYLMAARNSGQKNGLWWKKYITLIQLIQFLLVFLQAVGILLLNPACQYPKLLQCLIITMASAFVYMFGKFYINIYLRPQQRKL
ncbi:hypothetical protein KR222_002034, partial [Zaprionus bogoriensis]